MNEFGRSGVRSLRTCRIQVVMNKAGVGRLAIITAFRVETPGFRSRRVK